MNVIVNHDTDRNNRQTMKFRYYLAGTIFMVLLIWGPNDYSWPGWLAIRTTYLVLVPLVVWLLLGRLWNYWQLSKKLDTILETILSGIICIALIVLAVLEATSKIHLRNTRLIQTKDGMEAVDNGILSKGPDWGIVLFLVVVALLFFWFGVLRKGFKTSDL